MATMTRSSAVKILLLLSCGSFLYSTFLFFPKIDRSILPINLGFHRHSSEQLPVTAYRPLPSQIAQYFPPPDRVRKNYHEWNAQTLRELYTCVALNSCGANQQKVALLAAHWFEEAVVRDWRGGEGIWGMSVYKNLRALGYTTLFANSFDEALQQYRLFPDLVKVVIRNQAGDCHKDPNCVKGPNNPSGIPAWKIFDFEYFSSPDAGHYGASLMKGKWILSANSDPRFDDGEGPIQYIGFSLEEECSKIPVIPLAERSHQVWMLMKELTYVYDVRFSWNRSYFSLAAQELGIDFVGGWQIDQHYQWDPAMMGTMDDIEDKAHRVINKGRLNQTEFAHEIALSKMMIGVGNPFWSPSPYNALCQGIPFLNPIINWDRGDPWNKAKWHSQHPSLNLLDPPYVYNVHADDYAGFVEAIKLGTQTEITRFIPDYMTDKAVQTRLIRLLETDWKSEAAILLAERLAMVADGRDEYTFEL